MSTTVFFTLDQLTLDQITGGANRNLTPLAQQMTKLGMSRQDQRYFNGAVYSARAGRAGASGDMESAGALQERSDYWFKRAAGNNPVGSDSVWSLRVTPGE